MTAPPKAARVHRLASRLPEPLLFLVCLAAPWLSGWGGALLLGALLGLWLARRPRRHEAWWMAAWGLLTVLLVWGAGGWRTTGDWRAEAWRSRAERAYAELWSDLERVARHAAEAVPTPPRTLEERFQAFASLGEVLRRHPTARATLLVLDPADQPQAWAGPGLLHEVVAASLPARGPTYRASFAAVSLLAVEPLGGGAAGWRIVAGASHATDLLPFPRGGARIRWALVESPAESALGSLLLPLAGHPALVLAAEDDLEVAARERATRLRDLAWLALGGGLLWLGVGRLVRAAGGAKGHQVALAAALGGEGLVALALGAGAPATAWTTLAAGAAAASLALSGTSRQRPWLSGAAVGALAPALLVGAAAALQWTRPPLDVAAGFTGSPGDLAVRLGFFLAAWAPFVVAAAGPRTEERGRGVWPALSLLALAAALHDVPLAALPALLGGGWLLARWASRAAPLSRPAGALALALGAGLLAATAWETAYRCQVSRHLERQVLPRLGPPTEGELAALAREVEASFGSLGLEDLAPRDPSSLDRQDLAFALWRNSPLTRRGALSALVVLPSEGQASRFSFGLPITEGGFVDTSPARWGELTLPGWEQALLEGEVDLLAGGHLWGKIRFSLLLQPGFRVPEAGPLIEDVAAGLLRGGTSWARPDRPLWSPALHAVYSSRRPALRVPWPDRAPLPAALLRRDQTLVRTPAGLTRAYSSLRGSVVEVLYLPLLDPLEALERVGSHLAGVVTLVLAGGLLAGVAALPQPRLRRALGEALRTYSKRLLIVYTALLLVPLLLLNIFVLRVLGQRLERQQRQVGEAAVESAQRMLGEYVLGLEPGFGIETVLNDELLIWVSRVIHHDVNLYWEGQVYASSKPDLFTAGLLPKRIPGEIYSRLSLLGSSLSSRTNRVGTATYLELYAPLRVPGVGDQARLFLSLPLLAQQEEVEQEVASLRQRVLLLTMALFVLLMAAGGRLARNFTRPLAELIEGTRRIAAGASSLALEPRDLELAKLAAAIDEMARRIAEARERLVREKAVVERMVDNITSGIVSVDSEGRVLLTNRVAGELLGAEVGRSIVETVAGQETLQPVLRFLREAPPGPYQRTVTLRDGAGAEREWSLIWVPVPGEGEPAALLVVEDVTEVVRSQRLQAWAEMARIIAHEIKNPLTPIRLSAEHLRAVRRGDPAHFDQVFERCTANILRQVEELQEIVGDFSTYSRIPQIEPRRQDLVETVAGVVEGYRAAPPPGVAVSFAADPPRLVTEFDSKLLGRAVRNLIENALRVSPRGGEVAVRVSAQDGMARVSVADQGPGVEPDVLPRIFDPYFSTHAAGTGLGLPIARNVAQEHGGTIAARNLPLGGLEVAISIPIAAGPGSGAAA